MKYLAHKHQTQIEKGLIFHSQSLRVLLLGYYLVYTFLIITLPIFSAFFGYATINLGYFVKFSSLLAFSLRFIAPLSFKFIIIAYYKHFIYFVLVKDGDTT